MPIDEIINKRITGINPFDGLPIDAGIWKESHDNHVNHRKLHAAVAHRPGILYGLDVVASKTKEKTIVISPGVAIDANGETIVSREPLALTLTESRVNFVILYYVRGNDAKSAVTVGGGKHYFRVVEDHRIEAVRELPNTPYLELARVFRSGADKPLKDAAEPFDPEKDEINLLYRPIAYPHCYADCGVGELSYVGLTNPNERPPNRAGLCILLREGNAAGFHLTFTLPFNPEAEDVDAQEPALLYMAGRQGFQPRTNSEIDGLRNFLSRGGTFLGESGGSDEFTKGFQDLASKLGAKLKKVEPGHHLLSSHHVFSSRPVGAFAKGELLADTNAGVIFSSLDYGAAWQSEIEDPESQNARERIRQATEVGLNIVAFAAKRKRLNELSKLG